MAARWEGYALVLLLILGHLPLQAQSVWHDRLRRLERRLQDTQEELEDLKRWLQLQEKFSEELAQRVQAKAKRYQWVLDELDEQTAKRGYGPAWQSARLYFSGQLEMVYTQEHAASSWQARRVFLEFKSYLTDWLSAGAGVRLFAGQEQLLEYAALDLELYPWCNFRIGVLPVPFGRYNLFHDPPARDLTDPPLMAQRVAPVVWSDTGVMCYGSYTPAAFVAMNYQVMLSNGLGEGGFRDRAGSRAARPDFWQDNNHSKQVTGRLELIPHWGVEVIDLRCGFSGLLNRYDDDDNCWMYAWGVDGALRIGMFTLIGDHDQLEFSGEMACWHLDRDEQLLQRQPNTASASQGWYFQVVYRFFPEQWRDDYFFNHESSLALIFRYDYVDLDGHQQGGRPRYDDQEAYTFGVNLRPRQKTVMKLEYKWIREIHQTRSQGNNRLVISLATYF